MAGATTLGELASAIGARSEEAAIVAELKAGSEEAYAWLMGEFQQAFKDYRQKQGDLTAALETQFKIAAPATGAYAAADQLMKNEIARERTFLDLWTFNLNDAVHTGWPVEQLQASIAAADKAVAAFAGPRPAYPASSMFASFQEGMASNGKTV